MSRKYPDPEAPEVLEAVLKHMSEMTNEEWLAAMECPEGATETFRTKEMDNAEGGVGQRRYAFPLQPGGDDDGEGRSEEVRQEDEDGQEGQEAEEGLLKFYADELSALASVSYEDSDVEASHGEADNLLIASLRYFADRSSGVRATLLHRIICEWEKVPKWYA
jgi:hypothetical protein